MSTGNHAATQPTIKRPSVMYVDGVPDKKPCVLDNDHEGERHRQNTEAEPRCADRLTPQPADLIIEMAQRRSAVKLNGGANAEFGFWMRRNFRRQIHVHSGATAPRHSTQLIGHVVNGRVLKDPPPTASNGESLASWSTESRCTASSCGLRRDTLRTPELLGGKRPGA